VESNWVHSALWPPIDIMPAPGNYDDVEIDGMMIGRGNRSTRRKPAPLQLSPLQTPHAFPDANLAPRGGKPAVDRLNYSYKEINVFNYAVRVQINI
jgi:hypothetical protein